MSKARRIRKISVFTSGGKFPVLTLSYINTALSQSAFRIYKCYIIIEVLNSSNIIAITPLQIYIYFSNQLTNHVNDRRTSTSMGTKSIFY